MRQEILWVLGALLLAGLGLGTYFYFQSQDAALEPQQEAVPWPAPEAAGEPQIRHPVPGAETDAAPLPKLNESDQPLHDALVGIVGEEAVSRYLVPQEVIRHFVVTIDNLPRKKIALDLRPVKATPGSFVASGGGDSIVLDSENFARYTPLVQVVQAADAKQVAAVYRRFYPLFQEAYENLGYPSAYFNDRLIEVIDHLLETPEVKSPIKLVQPRVFYQFADPALESRSAGQKLLIRMGSENAEAIKAKLREIRAEVAAGEQKQ